MHVGVEEAVAQRMAQEGLDHRAAERLQVEALGLERGAVVERHAVDPFQRQHVARGAVPVDRRHAEIRIVLGVLRHLGERGGLEPQVHLDRDRAAPASRPPRSGAAAALRPTSCSAVRAAKVKASRSALEAAARCPAAAPSRRPAARAVGVTTSARCTCAIEAAATGGPNDGEDVAQRLAEARLRPRAPPRPAGTAASGPAGFEIARERDADHVRPRRQELAELDIGGAEPGQRGGEPVGGACWSAARSAARARARARRQRQRRRIDQREHALAREHEAGAGEAGEMGERGDHSRSDGRHRRSTRNHPSHLARRYPNP